jgi:hypothetical protein
MKDIGPFVGIGTPEEDLPSLGAARIYVEEPQWRDAVKRLIQRARLLVFRVGSSAGFLWEVQSAIASKKPEQMILLVPRDEALYEEFRRATATLFPSPLPALSGWNVKMWFRGNLKAVIFFDADWQPSIIDLQSHRLPFLHRSPATPLVPVIKSALEPVYRQLNLHWAPPGIDKRMLTVLLCGGVYGAFFLLWLAN